MPTEPYYGITEIIEGQGQQAVTVNTAIESLAVNIALLRLEKNVAGSGSPNVLTVTESHKAFSNEGTPARNYHDLPPAGEGMNYVFVVQDADGMRITAQAGHTIRIGASVSSSGGYAENTTIGSVLTLLGINTTQWFAIATVGTWTLT